MRRLSSPVFLYPLLALLVLGGVAAVYLFTWLPSREASLNNTALLSLAATGDQLSKRLSSMTNVLDALNRRKQPDEKDYLLAQAPWLEYETTSAEGAGPILDIEERGDPHFRVCANRRCVSASVEKVLSALLPRQGIFEDVILARQDGRTIYQTGLTALRIADISTLIELQRPAPATKQTETQPGAQTPEAERPLPGAPSITTAPIGGDVYVLYLMPAAFAGLAESQGAPAGCLLAGLVRQSQLRSLALSQSGTLFVTIALIALLVMLAAWPLLKFRQMGPANRVRRWSGLALLSSILASAGMTSLLVFHFSYLIAPDAPVITEVNGKEVVEQPETDARLKDLAGEMDGKAAAELKSVLQGLDSAESSEAFKEADIAPEVGREQPELPVRASVLLQPTAVFSTPYVFFDDIFWADAAGNQQIKWTSHSIVTPQTSLKTYSFFNETLNGNLWSLRCPESAGCPARRFRVDPLYSPNSGEYIATVTAKSHREGLATATMATRLASLDDPVLPPDYGFAVVDRDGTILFHSTPGPNIGRNLYPDLDSAGAMRAAASARSPQFVDAGYQGENDHFYVTPFPSLAGCPWTLLTFHRDAALGAKQVERVLLYFTFLLGFGLAAGSTGVLVLLRLPRYPSRWLWPEGSRNAEYLQLGSALFAIFAAATTIEFSKDWRIDLAVSFLGGLGAFLIVCLHLRHLSKPLGVLAAILASAAVWFESIPLGIIALACAGLISRRVTGACKRLSRHESKPGLYYSFAATALVFAAGVLPSIGFFKVANDFTHIKFLMRDELLTLQALEDRSHTLRQRYASLLAAKGAGWDLPRALILRARTKSSWDRLDDMSDSRWSPDQTEVWQDRALPVIQKIANLTRVIPNPGAELARRAANQDGSGCRPESVCWSFENEGWLRIHRPAAGGGDRSEELKTGGDAPPDSLVYPYYELSSLSNRWAVALLALLGVLLFFWLWDSLRRLYLLDVPALKSWPAKRVDELPELRKNTIAIGWPGIGKSRSLRREPGLNVIDTAEFLRGGSNWWNQRSGVAVLDQFDAALGALDDERALSLVEGLVRTGQPTAIVANSDPRLRIGQWLGEAGARDEKKLAIVSRWEAALASFETVLLAAGSEDSRPPPETLWAAATSAERVALFQLAHDGWANYKNREALIHLSRRGIIVRDPAFRIASEPFRDWIVERISGEQARDWSRQEGPSAWDGLRIVFVIVGLAILAAALFWAQRQGLALSALASAAGSAAKMVADFRGRKGAAAAAKAMQA
ncbi:MAG TPA: hypothetical protein VH639_13625 [Bryobacteraceae bacterium]|jgi:hypothetical protein